MWAAMPMLRILVRSRAIMLALNSGPADAFVHPAPKRETRGDGQPFPILVGKLPRGNRNSNSKGKTTHGRLGLILTMLEGVGQHEPLVVRLNLHGCSLSARIAGTSPSPAWCQAAGRRIPAHCT